MKLREGPFRRIKNGEQEIESRLFDEKRRTLHIGDIIIFTNVNSLEETLKTKITGLLHYPTFDTLYADLHSKYFSQYKWEELEGCMKIYYSHEDEIKYGAIAIRVEVLPTSI